METRRWTNPSQPQTLYMATFLLYINAAFALIFGGFLNPIVIVVAAASTAHATLGRRPRLVQRLRQGSGLFMAWLGVSLAFARRPATGDGRRALPRREPRMYHLEHDRRDPREPRGAAREPR